MEAAFRFTAKQEQAHAKVFYDHLKAFDGTDIAADGGYPVNLTASVAGLLRYAAENERKEQVSIPILKIPAFETLAEALA